MAGLEDVDGGDKLHTDGDVIRLPHAESDGTLVENAAVQPGQAVTYDGNAIAAATEGDQVIGVLANYSLYGDSSNGHKINASMGAAVATQGAFKARVNSDVTGGMVVGGPDQTNGTVADAGEFDDATKAASNTDYTYRVLEVYNDGTDDWGKLVL